MVFFSHDFTNALNRWFDHSATICIFSTKNVFSVFYINSSGKNNDYTKSISFNQTYTGQESIPNTSADKRMHECGESSEQLTQLLDHCVSKIKFKPGKLPTGHSN